MSANSTKKVSRKAAPTTREKLVHLPAAENDTTGNESVSLGRGSEGARMALGYSRVMRGRPKKGTVATGTSTRSLRLPEPEWEALDELAQERGMSTHAVMREAIVQWLARAGAKR